eukprot:gene4362-5097_t
MNVHQIDQYNLRTIISNQIKDGKEAPSTVASRDKAKTATPAKKRIISNNSHNNQDDDDEEENSTTFEMDANGNIIQKARTFESMHYDTIDDTNAFINSNSFTRRDQARRWDPAETQRFYEALEKYGTDFSLIENIFENRTRRQLKTKYLQEVKKNPDFIHSKLNNRGPINLEEYQQKSREMKQSKLAEIESNKKKSKAVAEGRSDQGDEEDDMDDVENELDQRSRSERMEAMARRGGNGQSDEVVMDISQYNAQQALQDQLARAKENESGGLGPTKPVSWDIGGGIVGDTLGAHGRSLYGCKDLGGLGYLEVIE